MKYDNITSKRIKIFVILAIVVLGGLLAVKTFSAREIPEQVTEVGREPEQTTEIIEYVVRLEKGTVNVYKRDENGETYSYSISGVNVFDLPDKTAEELKNGMIFKSEADVERLIEEITS